MTLADSNFPIAFSRDADDPSAINCTPSVISRLISASCGFAISCARIGPAVEMKMVSVRMMLWTVAWADLLAGVG